MIIAKIGERTYEMKSFEDVTQARSIYANSTGSQNEFEDELESSEIDFFYDVCDFIKGEENGYDN